MSDPGASATAVFERYATSVVVRYSQLKKQHLHLKKKRELQKDQDKQELRLQQQSQRRQHLKGALQRREKRNQVKIKVTEKENAVKRQEQMDKREHFKKRYAEKKQQKSNQKLPPEPKTWLPPTAFKPYKAGQGSTTLSSTPPRTDSSLIVQTMNPQSDARAVCSHNANTVNEPAALLQVESILVGSSTQRTEKKSQNPNKKVHFDSKTIREFIKEELASTPQKDNKRVHLNRKNIRESIEEELESLPQPNLLAATETPACPSSTQKKTERQLQVIADPEPVTPTLATIMALNEASVNTTEMPFLQPLQKYPPPPSFSYGQRRHYRTVVPVRVLVEPSEVGSDPGSQAGAFTW